MKRAAGLALLVCMLAATFGVYAEGNARLNLVFVLDGLRPDSINAGDTPTLFKLRSEGVEFTRSHSVFPTVTRVNATAFGSGMYPEHNGMMGNNIYIPAVNAVAQFSNDSMRNLLHMDEVTGGNTVLVPTLAAYLTAAGKRFVVVSTGSSGTGFLLAPKAASMGTGILIHAEADEELRPAYPEAIAAEVSKRFGAAPKKGGPTSDHMASVDWGMNVLRDYVLPELNAQVVFTWMTEPDHSEHAHGTGSPEMIKVLRNDDRQLGLVLDKLEALGLRDKTNIMVVSDHGFSQIAYGVGLKQALVDAGLMAAAESDELVLASSGEAILIHVKNHDKDKIAKIAAFLKQQSWCGVLFTAGDPAKPAYAGSVPGTFSIDFIHLGGNARSPDLVLTFPWTSARNAFGYPGTDYQMVSGKSGTGIGATANHGSMSPYTVGNTMLAWGPDFKRGVKLRTPSANVDIAPTLLYLTGITTTTAFDGRVLMEALANGPDEEKIDTEVRTLHVADGAFRSAIQVTETGGKRYIDKSWRE